MGYGIAFLSRRSLIDIARKNPEVASKADEVLSAYVRHLQLENELRDLLSKIQEVSDAKA